MKTTLFAIGIGLLLTVVAAPAEAEPVAPDMMCMQVYSETELGPVTVVRRNSCAVPEVYVNEGFSNHGLPAPTMMCSQVYSETNVGPFTVVRRNSCAVPEVQVNEGFSNPELPFPVYCAQVYTERDIGPVTVVQSSSCSAPRVQPNEDFEAGHFAGNPTDLGCTWSLEKYSVGFVTVVLPAKCQALDDF